MSEVTAVNGGGGSGPTWARGNAGAGTRWGKPDAARRSPSTDRLRKTIEGLPDWEPLPPGEAPVRRSGRDG